MILLFLFFSLIATAVYPLYDTCLIKEIIFLPIGLSFLTWSFFEKHNWLKDPGTYFGLWLILNIYAINGEFLKWVGCLGVYFYVRQANNVRWPLVVGGIVVALYNLYLLNGNLLANHFSGSFVNPNIAGGYWLLYAFLFLSAGWTGAIGVIGSLYFMYISSCRGSFMGLIAGLIALLTAYKPKIGLSVLTAGVIIGGWYWYFESSGRPLTDRYLFYQGTLDIIRSHWIAGSGTGSFSAIFPIFADPGLFFQYGNNFYISHCHNFLLELLAEQGIIGLSLFIWLMIWNIKRAKNFRDYCLVAGVIAIQVYGWTAVGLNFVPVMPLFFAMLAMIGKEV